LVPIAVVNGTADRLVNLDYIDSVAYGNLWEGRCHRLAGLGHAPFWEAPGEFDPILERFLHDVETGRAAARTLSLKASGGADQPLPRSGAIDYFAEVRNRAISCHTQLWTRIDLEVQVARACGRDASPANG
jgi:hypothetical protein